MHDQRNGNVPHNIPWLIGTESTNDFTLYGITLRNAPNFNVFLAGGDGVTVWGVKIDEPWNSPNTDGIDPSGCTNVTITQSYIRNGDDGVAIKAPKGKPSKHITISHDHFYEGHGMSIGSGTEGGISAVRFTDLTIDHMKTGIHIKSNPGRGGHVQDVVYDGVRIRNTATPIDVETTYIDANAPRAGWANGAAFPLYTDNRAAQRSDRGRDAAAPDRHRWTASGEDPVRRSVDRRHKDHEAAGIARSYHAGAGTEQLDSNGRRCESEREAGPARTCLM